MAIRILLRNKLRIVITHTGLFLDAQRFNLVGQKLIPYII